MKRVPSIAVLHVCWFPGPRTATVPGQPQANAGPAANHDASPRTFDRKAFGNPLAAAFSTRHTIGAGLDFLSLKRPFGVLDAEGNHIGRAFNPGDPVSLPMRLGGVTATPSPGLRYAYLHANRFGESGAGGENLRVGTDNVHSPQPYAQVALDHTFGNAFRPVQVEVRVGNAYERLDANRAVSVVAQDGTLFMAPGTALPRGYLGAGAGVTLHPYAGLDVSLNYDGLVNTTHASAQQGGIHMKYPF